MEYQKCVILLRASTKKALVHQEEACRALAKKRELEVCRVFKEKGHEPLKKRKKGVLRWMRAYLFNENVKYLITYKQNTIALNNSEFFLIRCFLENCDVEYFFVKETKQPNF